MRSLKKIAVLTLFAISLNVRAEQVDNPPPLNTPNLLLPSECTGECYCLDSAGLDKLAKGIEDQEVCEKRYDYLLKKFSYEEKTVADRIYSGVLGFAAAFAVIYFTGK